MKKNQLFFTIVLLLVFIASFNQSCIKEDFNDPPSKVGFHGALALPVGSFVARIPSIDLPLFDSLSIADSLLPNPYPISKTIPFKLSGSIEKPEFIEWVTFKLKLQNLFPATTSAQVYFTDGNMRVFDSLFHQGLLFCSKADLNEDGMVNSSGNNAIELQFPRQRIDSFYNVRFIVLKVNLVDVGQNPDMLEFYDSLYVNASLALAIGLKIDF